MTLSGGMKRRVLIAKALSHEPSILFLDEPTAGVDVELRKDMWETVRSLRDSGVTIILTTHYIHEAEDMADRIGVINKGELILVEDKVELMHKLGKKQLTLQLHQSLDSRAGGAWPPIIWRSPMAAASWSTPTTRKARAPASPAFSPISSRAGIRFKDLDTTQSSLEDIFVDLVRQSRMKINLPAIKAIYKFEMARWGRTVLQSIVSPVIATSLYFVVFGAAIGSRITEIDGIAYGAFIVPGLMMLTCC